MAPILILCLLATLNCDIISTFFCLLGNEKIRTFANEVISKIKNKEWDSLPVLVIENFSSLKNAVVSCIGPKEEEVVLKDEFDRYELCRQKCSGNMKYDPEDPGIKECIRFCTSKGGK